MVIWPRLIGSVVVGALFVAFLYAVAFGIGWFAGGNPDRIFLAIMCFVWTAHFYYSSMDKSEEKPA